MIRLLNHECLSHVTCRLLWLRTRFSNQNYGTPTHTYLINSLARAKFCLICENPVPPSDCRRSTATLLCKS